MDAHVAFNEGQGIKKLPLWAYLTPEHTGSSQGQIEDIQNELDHARKCIGNILSYMVTDLKVPLEVAENLAGMSKYHVEYRYPNRQLGFF